MVLRCCAVGGDMKTPRLVAQWQEQEWEAKRLDEGTWKNLKGLGYDA
jgi:hypothetical protein